MKQEAEDQRRARHRRAALRRLHDRAQVGDVTSIRRLFHEHGRVMGEHRRLPSRTEYGIARGARSQPGRAAAHVLDRERRQCRRHEWQGMRSVGVGDIAQLDQGQEGE